MYYKYQPFLCRQTDLLVRSVELASLTDKVVNIKKGNFYCTMGCKGILSKTGTDNVWITERGTSFGYNTLTVDFTGIQYMTKEFDVPIIFDATHCVQNQVVKVIHLMVIESMYLV